MASELYLDSASGPPLLPEAREAVLAAMDRFGDPLLIHRPGREARAFLDEAREAVASALSAQPDEIVFTSGGTESVALAIRGCVRRRPGTTRIVVGAIEHPSVVGAANELAADGVGVAPIPVDRDGRLDVDRLAAEVRRPGTGFASIQHANHELGTIQPLAEAARLAREVGVRVHADACQTVGRLPVDVQALGVDLLSLSAHKFGGPGGTGALFVRRGVAVAGHPSGDDRERRRRAGIENLAGIAGMAAALTASLVGMADRASVQWSLTASLRDRISAEVPGATVHGHPTQRTPHLVCFSVAGVDPATLMMTLDDRGFHVGIGSIVSGRAEDPSPVLDRIGHPATASIRAGLDASSSGDDVARFADALRDTVLDLRRMEAASTEALTRFSAQDP